MKKVLLILVLAMTMVFSAACGSGNEGGGNAGGAGEVAGLTAYQQLNQAYAAYEEATSISMEFVMDMDMSIEGESFMTYRMTGDIEMNMDDVNDIQLAMDTKNNISMMGENVDMDAKAYYRDGYYYMEMEGMQFKTLMPMEDAMEQAALMEMGFEENAVKSQEINGNQLTFVLDGEAMSYLFEESMGDVMSQFGSDASLSYSDVKCVAVLSNDGADLDSMTMETEMTITIMGETAIATMTMTMDVKQVGNVTVNFPADLDDYMEVDADMLGL